MVLARMADLQGKGELGAKRKGWAVLALARAAELGI